MANGRNNPDNQFVKAPDNRTPKGDRNRIVIEPSEAEAAPQPKGRYSDRIKVPAMDDAGRATPKAVRNWPEGLKRA